MDKLPLNTMVVFLQKLEGSYAKKCVEAVIMGDGDGALKQAGKVEMCQLIISNLKREMDKR